MKGKLPKSSPVATDGGKVPWPQHALLAATALLVVVFMAMTARSGLLEYWGSGADTSYYNLLVQGFRAGQLNLKVEVPSGLTRLADPYDPEASLPYRWKEGQPLHDLSYYQGKLHLYWGPVPALLLFWPYAAVTGHYLLHRDAVVIFCALGFLAGAGLWYALWRRYFPKVNVGVVAAGMLALGLAPALPMVLSRCDVYEVAISCGYALTVLSLAATWRALHEPARGGRWLALASLAYGLAVGSRPSLLPGAAFLLVPVFWGCTGNKPRWYRLLAAIGPMMGIGLALMSYNAARFGSPWEFGQRYQLALERQDTMQHFSLRYLAFNVWEYFLGPARWGSGFPFVHESRALALPAGHVSVQRLFGILTSIPLVWLALAAPLAWREERGTPPRAALRAFGVALILVFGVNALVVCLFNYTCVRYLLDFLPALVLLALVGLLGWERKWASLSARRGAARWGWVLLLAVSLGFNLLAGIEHRALAEYDCGQALLKSGRPDRAVGWLRQALQWDAEPGFVAEVQSYLGIALSDMGKTGEAVYCYQLALKAQPDCAIAHNNLGIIWAQQGRLDEALLQFQAAVRCKPDYAIAHNSLGNVLSMRNRYPEALPEYAAALAANPDYAEAHNNLAYALVQLGRPEEAVGHCQAALRLNPSYAQAHYNLGWALARLGRRDEAVAQFRQVLQLSPDDPAAKQQLQELLGAPGPR
jgi:tetratricopeptide (TPR) repeat protein